MVDLLLAVGLVVGLATVPVVRLPSVKVVAPARGASPLELTELSLPMELLVVLLLLVLLPAAAPLAG